MTYSFPYTVDFETTGKDATTARPIEVGLACPDDGAWSYESFISLPPGEKIPPETSAVHHIVDEDIRGAPYWPETLVTMRRQMEVDGSLDGVVLIAHNSEYEQTMLANTEFAALPWVCTMKCAMVAFPDAPSFGNEALRYWLQLGSNRGRAHMQGAHSALHDAKVTAALFNCLYGQFYMLMQDKLDKSAVPPREDAVRNAVISKMVEVTKLPAQLPTCPIGDEWRGKPWSEVDAGFLAWMINKPVDRADAIHCAKQELLRRGVSWSSFNKRRY